MKYTAVKNAHIVPRLYLKAFSRDGLIGVHIDHARESMSLPVAKVGTRRRYYRRTRPDGTSIDDVEWSLQEIETRSSYVLRNVIEEWPLLDVNKKGPLAQLIAAQWVRVPNWMSWHRDNAHGFLAEHRLSSKALSGMSDTSFAELEDELLSDSRRLFVMLQVAYKLMPIIASMHWTLVEFRRPILCTCDQPLVMWPRAVRAQRPLLSRAHAGIFDALEIRFPLSPRHLLMMTWADLEDEDAHRWGASHHARNLNAFTVAQSDRQWFHLPGAASPRAAGRLLPISPELIRGYSGGAAERSARRARATEIANALKGQRIERGLREWDIVTMRRNVATA